MPKIKLKKRKYLGKGYGHEFRNILTGKRKFVPCTQEEYENLALPDAGTKYNPIPDEGWEWVCSHGGTVKVDTENTLLGENEFTIIGSKRWAHAKNKEGKMSVEARTKAEFDNDFEEEI